jgi:hypothetical protein
MEPGMEVLRFASSAQFMQWAKRVVKDKDQHYSRAPVGGQTWTYGDRHTVETKMGQKGGTLLANLQYMFSTATGAMEHSRDAQIVKDIDSRGGVVLTINWGEQAAKDD